MIAKFGADALRYYCFREVSFGQDGQISPAGFEARYETELANEYGNLANRTLSMIGRYRDGAVPEAEAETELAGAFEGAPERVRELLDDAELTQALEEIWKLVRRLNQYVEETRPWDLAKDESASGRLDSVLYGLAEGLRVTTLLLHAYMPETTAEAARRSRRARPRAGVVRLARRRRVRGADPAAVSEAGHLAEAAAGRLPWRW